MRFIDVVGGFQTAISNDEHELCNRIRQSKEPFPASKLTAYEKEIVRKLVQKDIINRALVKNSVYYIFNELNDSWR